MKKFLAVFMVLILVLSLAGCGSTTTSKDSGKGTTKDSDDKSKDSSGKASDNTLTVWCWDPAFNIYAMQEAEKIYKETNPDFKLNIVETTWDDVQTKITTAASSGQLDTLPDIFLMQDNAFQKNYINYFKKAEMSAHYWLNNYKDKGKEIHMFLTMLLAENEEQKPEYEFVCQKLLQVLLVQVMRDTDSNIITTDKFMHKKINKECSRVKRYLDSNYSDHITLDLLANITHMNKYYLIHAFTKYTGMSPINYLKSRRLEESKTLLETTDMTVAGICNNVGFSSQAYFSQAFKKHTGISPNEYRKKIKNSDELEI